MLHGSKIHADHLLRKLSSRHTYSQYNMEPMPDMSGKLRKVYLASMRSLGGDTICGYVAIPVEKGTYPVHIYYNGYGSEPWCVDADSNSEWIDFVIFTRGQGLCKKYNKYGDWITFGVGDPHVLISK